MFLDLKGSAPLQTSQRNPGRILAGLPSTTGRVLIARSLSLITGEVACRKPERKSKLERLRGVHRWYRSKMKYGRQTRHRRIRRDTERVAQRKPARQGEEVNLCIRDSKYNVTQESDEERQFGKAVNAWKRFQRDSSPFNNKVTQNNQHRERIVGGEAGIPNREYYGITIQC